MRITVWSIVRFTVRVTFKGRVEYTRGSAVTMYSSNVPWVQ